MAGIKAGDNGTDYEFLVRDGGEVVPLNGATVTIVIKPSGRDPIEKAATITDPWQRYLQNNADSRRRGDNRRLCLARNRQISG
jgi:hypothetical protein